jgi:deoxyhypusine synthase
MSKKTNSEKMRSPLGVNYKTIKDSAKEPCGDIVKGYDFNNGFLDMEKLFESFKTTGAQATNLFRAAEIIEKMRSEKAYIYLGYTSNMVTTGIREIIRYLVQNKYIDYLVTTCGGIEEDIIKCLGDFKIGDFEARGKDLRSKYINRAGNIFIPSLRYVEFEKFVLPILNKFRDKISDGHDLINLLGKEINHEESICYWAQKNNIPIYCPAIMDGSLGDMIYNFKLSNPEFKIDISSDGTKFNNSSIGKGKTGMIILGGGVIKHSICNANLYRNGADYAVYINTAAEFDGSDSGAKPDEAVSWGKITQRAESVKVFADATIVFPLIVNKAFFKA